MQPSLTATFFRNYNAYLIARAIPVALKIFFGASNLRHFSQLATLTSTYPLVEFIETFSVKINRACTKLIGTGPGVMLILITGKILQAVLLGASQEGGQHFCLLLRVAESFEIQNTLRTVTGYTTKCILRM